MTFCVQRYINLHEFGHLLLIFFRADCKKRPLWRSVFPISVVADTLPESCVKDKTRGKSENYP